MYEGGVKVTSTQEYLEGKPYEEPKEEAPKTALGLFQNAQPTPEQDTWNRLREDPLLEIKRQEQKSLEFIKKNPVKMAMIKNKLYEMEKKEKEAKKRKHKEKKEEKKSKRHKHEHHHHHHDDKKEDRRDKREPEENKPLKTGYGLIYPKGAPKTEGSTAAPADPLKDFETIKQEMRMKKAEEREERDREARRKRDERKQRQGAFRHMSAEERKRKLEEMQQDAAVNEERRDRRLKRHRDEEAKKDERDVSTGDAAVNFLNDVKKKAYSKAGVATLEERLTRNVHYRYKGNLDEANTFKEK